MLIHVQLLQLPAARANKTSYSLFNVLACQCFWW